jgi:hypothetical protein
VQGEGSEGWREGWLHLDQLVPGPGSLLLFTSFTAKEAVEDLARFKKYAPPGCTVLLAAQRNPMSGRRPARDPTLDDNEDVFFANGYISVVTRGAPAARSAGAEAALPATSPSA